MGSDFSITPITLQGGTIAKGSRGRNGTFTAQWLSLHAHRSSTPGEQSFLSLSAYSRRSGQQAPAQITISLEDGIILAETILEEVGKVLGLSAAELHRAKDPHCTCNDCMAHHIEGQEGQEATSAPRGPV